MKKLIVLISLLLVILAACATTVKNEPNNNSRTGTNNQVNPPVRPKPLIVLFPPEKIIKRADGGIIIGEIHTRRGKIIPLVFTINFSPRSGTRGSSSSEDAEINSLIAELTEIINGNPDDIEAYIQRAALFLERGRRQDLIQAIADCETVLAKDDSIEDAYYIRGIASARLNNNEQVISDMSSVLDAENYENISAMYLLGRSYYLSNNDEQAMEMLEGVVALAPDFLDAAQMLDKLKERNR